MKKDQNIAQENEKTDEIAVGYDLPSFPKEPEWPVSFLSGDQTPEAVPHRLPR
jgi:hypothetical protein